ncbi:MAG TPA: ribosomal protein S18-alanine N-acetyltransferase [Verrucomicrobiae bacterium]|nr:ribosomal protein S18-alanine N-acetyltransferase [Verrucomicrobiae bacterium]
MSAQLERLWNLRPMHEAHLEQVLDIERRAYPFPWTDGIFRDCLKVGYSAWIVAGPEGEVLAYSVMSMAVGEAHILNLCVEPAYHQQGLGRFLLSHLQRLARGAGMDILLLEVRKSNAAAIALYQSSGFQKLGVRKGYYPANNGQEDALLLGFTLRPGASFAP